MTEKSARRASREDPSPAVLGEYRGKWVAVLHGSIVASANRALDVLQQVEREYPNDRPSVYRVPAGEVMLL